ncbi:MAG: hypothetical protein R3Y53_01815 [Bacillota bacterium]
MKDREIFIEIGVDGMNIMIPAVDGNVLGIPLDDFEEDLISFTVGDLIAFIKSLDK